MARVALTPVTLDDAGIALPAGIAGTVDGFAITNNNGDKILLLKNTGAGSHTATLPTPATRDDLAVADRTVTLAAGQTKLVGPLSPSIYNQSGADQGSVFVNVDSTYSEVSAAVLKIP